MTRLIRILLFSLLLTAQLAFGENLFPSSGNTSTLNNPAEFLSVTEAYSLEAHADNQTLVFDWSLQPGYYLYQHRFRFFNPDGSALELTPNFEPGVRIYDDYYEKELEVYYQKTQFTLPWNTNQTSLVVESQACSDAGLCYPPRQQIITLAANTPFAVVTDQGSISNNRQNQMPMSLSRLPLMLLFALLGGAILNLMPCVFPILSIKALSLATAHQNSQNSHLHGIAYASGIILSFMAIAALLMLLRSAGEAVGWGFQLQSPIFVGLLVYLFVLMGLSFSGLLTLGTGLMSLGQSTTEGRGLSSSFMTGLLATAVASPCTAPFMGTALGFALTQPPWVAMSTFASLGFGMALPMLILSWWPGLTEKMPRPGIWMECFKEFLAFPLYLTAVWLLWVLGRQAGSDTVAAMICSLVLIFFAIWLFKVSRATAIRILACILVMTALFIPWKTNDSRHQQTPWQPYTEATLNQLLTNGNAVFIDLTADWCITCLANEKLVLNSEKFLAALQEQHVTYLKGDWTNYNPEITRLLNTHRRSGVPLYLFYPPGSKNPHILPQILTKNNTISAISAPYP